MSLARQISKNFLIQGLGKVGSVLLGLAMLAILTRHLGPEGYGEYTTATTFLQFFGVIADFGLTLTMVVMISEAGADEKLLVGNILGLRLASATILFGLAPLFVMPFPWNDTVKMAVAAGAGGYLFMAGAALLNGVYQKHAAMTRAAASEVASRVVLLLTIILFVYLNLGVVAMSGAIVFANGVWLWLSIRLARPYVQIKLQGSWPVWKNVLSRSWPIAISIFFNLIYLKGDLLFLAYYRPQTEVGFYGASYRFLDVLTTIPTMFMGLLLPALTAAWSGGDKNRFALMIEKTSHVFLAAAFPIIAGAYVIGPQLIRLVAGDAFLPATSALRLLMLASIGIFLGALFGHAVVAINKQKSMIAGYVAVAILSVVGYYLFIPSYGMTGAAGVTIFSEVLIAILTYRMVAKTTHIPIRLRWLLRPLFASVLMYVILTLLPAWPAIPMVFIGAAVYIPTLLLVGGISKSDIAILRGRV
ncbi:flippase [Candidatus Uhrbacteria bacterium]|nr:flippase [Candidatus Uhrbacteria bacterium]